MRSWMKKLNIFQIPNVLIRIWVLIWLNHDCESRMCWVYEDNCWYWLCLVTSLMVTCSHGQMIVLRCQHYKPQSLVNNISHTSHSDLPAQYWSIGVKSGSPRWWPVLPMCCWSQSKEAVSKHPVISCQPTHCPGYLWYQCQHTEPDFLWSFEEWGTS